MHKKSKALDSYKKFRILVEKEVGRPLQIMRSDRGGEYNSLDFIKYYDDTSIKKQLTTPYTYNKMEYVNEGIELLLIWFKVIENSHLPKNFCGMKCSHVK